MKLNKSKAKGILLFSGGLDSMLAAKVLMEQDIELLGINYILPFQSPFLDTDSLFSSKIAKDIGLNLKYCRFDNEYIEMLKNPPNGYGKNINPCIDCKIFILKIAERIMHEENADFIATGEVVGQRPMSQLKNTLRHIEKSLTIENRLLRPLSAKILEPTIPEIEGKIDRSLLYGISGRGRNEQLKLAEKFGITDFQSPAGGCAFTDRNISNRMFDIIKHKENIESVDLYLCTIGRHFRINDKLKIVVARDEKECSQLFELKEFYSQIFVPKFSGPTVLISGVLKHENYNLVSSLINRYGKYSEENNKIEIYENNSIIDTISCDYVMSDDNLNEMRI